MDLDLTKQKREIYREPRTSELEKKQLPDSLSTRMAKMEMMKKEQ
jgi:hypothetical protein